MIKCLGFILKIRGSYLRIFKQGEKGLDLYFRKFIFVLDWKIGQMGKIRSKVIEQEVSEGKGS